MNWICTMHVTKLLIVINFCGIWSYAIYINFGLLLESMNHGSFNIIFITPLQFTKTLDMQTLASSQIVVLTIYRRNWGLKKPFSLQKIMKIGGKYGSSND